jgi:hypothetical protein
VSYAGLLESSDYFSRVVVQSIISLPDMTKPGSSGQGQDSLMGTPVPVFPGQPALQTFGVAEEENSASFLAKADRYYEVSTTKLAPGVDTVLTISLEDGPTYTNDDAAAGTLASKITFQAPPANAVVRIRVKNLGEFGPERTYQLLVKEVVPKAGTTEDEQATSPTQSPDAEDSSGHVITIATPTPSPVPTLGSDDGIVEFAILVEVKPQVP